MTLDDGICDGCGEPGATEQLTLNAPLGRTSVYVHRNADCANLAREARGGGRFSPRTPESQEGIDYEAALARARARAAQQSDEEATRALYDRLRASLLRSSERRRREGR